ncbi:DUF2398 family protein [Streptomyces sp. TRM68367]|uniref:DUF2398 family protein n=1 Tax=Streptomyces sp. TRM68367 TaxID=2758415 RepID=UPI0021D1A866|nr:DUF2398 family protein [Streptomyces sp. TRM68367]
MSRVAEGVSPLELADYQKAVRLVLRHPLVTPGYPDKAALATVRRWAGQMRHRLDGGVRLPSWHHRRHRPVAARPGRPGRHPSGPHPCGPPLRPSRHAYLVLTLAALGRHGAQVALGELADTVAADAVRIDGLGLDTARKPDRDAFVDAVTWLTERGALTLADGSATAWSATPSAPRRFTTSTARSSSPSTIRPVSCST